MKITFILPGNSDVPVGGYKLIYQYANKLVDLGHNVTIAFMYHPYDNKNIFFKNIEFELKKHLGYEGNKPQVTWFPLDEKIGIVQNLLNESDLPVSDKIIATAPETAILLSRFKNLVGDKYYFIQNHEVWNLGKEKLSQTYLLPLKKIVIAKWLRDEVYKITNETPEIVPNFYDHSIFYLENNVDARDNIVTLLNHSEPTKRTKFGLQVLAEVKKRVPNLHVNLFGTGEMPKDLPSYVSYYQKPSEKELRENIYGTAKVYLMPTILEGWSLTGMEAMACGAVVVGSDIGGLHDYISNHVEGELIDQNDFDQYVEIIVDMLKDNCKRVSYTERAQKSVVRHDIKNSVDILLEVLTAK